MHMTPLLKVSELLALNKGLKAHVSEGAEKIVVYSTVLPSILKRPQGISFKETSMKNFKILYYDKEIANLVVK